MIQRNLKKLFFSFLKTKNIAFLVLFFFIIFGLVFPLHPAQAIDWISVLSMLAGPVGALGTLFNMQLMWTTVANVAIAFATLFLQIPLMAANLFLSAAVGILAITTSPNFISLSYTQPAGNPILAIGWTLTRDLANMGFVIALVIIGLATALRLGEYQWQKTLPRLILMALLINFTPIIMGLIVDASNIAMHFFLGDMINWDFLVNLFAAQVNTTLDAFRNVGSNQINGDALGRMMALVVFGFIAGFMILTFAFLFILRYIAIWILVILSPIAFFASVLPATKGFFQTWWKQFINWCMIGVTAAFFLYLTGHLLGLAPGLINTKVAGETSSNTPGVINTLLPYGVAISFLIIGFFVALSGSAMGSAGVIAFAQKGAKATGAWAKKKGVSAARGVPVISRTEEAVRRRMETVPVIGGAFGGRGAFAAELNKDRKKAGENLDTMTPAEIRNVMRARPLIREDRLRRARGLEILAEKNQITAADVQQYGAEATRWGVQGGTLYNKLPNAAPNIRQRVEGMDSEEFRKNVLAGAFETRTPAPAGAPPGTPPTLTYTDAQLEVFNSMDLTKVHDLGHGGLGESARAKRRALYNLIVQRRADIVAEIAALRAAGNNNEADKINTMWVEIFNSPNYR
ncbi:MAG: hypothetical protein Q7S82_00510 [bacterium]|nr:hypothetical protein [bacterium]